MTPLEFVPAPVWIGSGWVMLHFLWLGGLVALVAAGLRALLPARARLQYAVALGFFMLLALSPALIALRLVAAHAPGTLVQPAGANQDVAMAAAPLPALDTGARPHPDGLLDRLVRFLPWVWLAGAPCMLVVLASGLIGSERLRRQSVVVHQDDVIQRCRRLAAVLGLRGDVPIALCPRLAGPILVGILRPLILLPPLALAGWSAEHLEMVLLHELAHVRRWDNLVNLLQRLVEALLFFHPAVWWLSAWVRLEREMCCDQAVIAHTGCPRAYAEVLAVLALPAAPRGAVAMAAHPLVMRIRRLLNVEDRSMGISTRFVGPGLALTAVLLVILVVGARAGHWSDVPPAEGPAPAAPAAEPPALDPARPAQTPQEGGDQGPASPPKALSQRGRVEAYEQVQLYSRVAGTVREVSVGLGDVVKRGQLLLALDAPDVELDVRKQAALLAQGRAEIAVAESSLQAARAAVRAAEAQVQEADAVLKSADATRAYRQRHLERVKNLLRNQSVNADSLDEADEKFEAAQSARATAAARLQVVRAMLGETTAKLARSEADLLVAQARLQVAEIEQRRVAALLDSTQVRAPIDGVVARRPAPAGSFVAAPGPGNAEALVVVARTDRVRVVADFPESDVARLAPGMAAVVEVDAFPGRRFEGKVSRLAPSLDAQTRLLRAEIDLPNTDARLLPGMTALVRLRLGK
jgi:multidrug resistance efflux pump/beta-lactamase regulating signal transducer with metallopeptidase domain